MIRKAWQNLEEILGAALVLAVCAVMVVNVGSRYVTRTPAAWAEEVGRYLFVYLVFVGASLALKKRDHFAVDFLVEKLPPRAARAMRVFSSAAVIVFALLVTGYGAKLVVAGWGTVAAATEMPRAVPHAAVPLGGLLMLARGIEDLVRRVRGEASGPPPPGPAAGVE
ncbi:MAG: TRAP transporter small permease [Planctomycetes bacterium]|nr:TRAP transporter small permease [Planctomycetota bacterium]